MKPAETKRLYERECRSRRIRPEGEMAQEECALWHRKLRDFNTADVDQALNDWAGDQTPGDDGQPRGRWVPKPAELIPLIIAVERRRQAAAAVKTYLVRWKCPLCKYTMMGHLPAGSQDARRCPSHYAPSGIALPENGRCGAQMEVVFDERPKA